MSAYTIAVMISTRACCACMHAFLGCDTISSLCFMWHRKENYLGCVEVLTTLFGCLYQTPEANTDDMKEKKRFVVSLYSRTSQLFTVNTAWKQHFSYGNSWKIFLLPEKLYIST